MPYLLLAALAGTLLAIQANVNAGLRTQLGHPVLATLVSFIVGTFSLAIWALALRLPLPSTSMSEIAWWRWTGGVLGALYLASVVFLVPKLGSATLFGLVIFGQLVASVVIDHFGWFGLPPHTLNPQRIAGVLLMMAGVWFIQKF